MFVVLDGIDGAGKSTQATLLADWLRAAGRSVVMCRDPGGPAVSERIRDLLLDPKSEIGLRCEMLLYMAARAQLVEKVIAPALAAGSDVISDRFLLANLVYQGVSGELPRDEIETVGRIATRGATPDVTILLDLPVATAATRLNRALDRMEQQNHSRKEQLRERFLWEAARDPERIEVVDASQDASAMQGEIRRIILRRSPELVS